MIIGDAKCPVCGFKQHLHVLKDIARMCAEKKKRKAADTQAGASRD